MSLGGWFKVHRALFENSLWIDSTNDQRVLLMVILSRVNINKAKWMFKGEMIELNPGEFVTSLDKLCILAKIKRQVTRTALKKFERYGFLTQRLTQTGRVISVINWDTYQGKGTRANTDGNIDLTQNQHTTNTELTPNKEVKKIKESKKIKNKTIYSSSNIIDYLNIKTGSKYRNTYKTSNLIKARINEGFNEQDFYTVIDKKVIEWNNTDFSKYLRPETLFGVKFEGYLNQLETIKQSQSDMWDELIKERENGEETKGNNHKNIASIV